jgi:hypothetical protein
MDAFGPYPMSDHLYALRLRERVQLLLSGCDPEEEDILKNEWEDDVDDEAGLVMPAEGSAVESDSSSGSDSDLDQGWGSVPDPAPPMQTATPGTAWLVIKQLSDMGTLSGTS